jgi:DNA invertase Pin-like site-specific DNA recombinase
MANGRYIAYFRVSTEKQGRSGLGLEAQERAVRDFLNGGSWALLDSYTEIESGRDKARPELPKGLTACRVRGATLVIAKRDRLTRDTKLLLDLVDSGVDVVFCDLPQIPAGPMGRFMLTQMAAIAELEAGLISHRTKAALEAAKARGTRLGGFRGYVLSEDDRRVALDTRRAGATRVAADILPIIKAIRAEGIASARGIARVLTERGIRTPRGSTVWSVVQVQRLLSRSANVCANAR